MHSAKLSKYLLNLSYKNLIQGIFSLLFSSCQPFMFMYLYYAYLIYDPGSRRFALFRKKLNSSSYTPRWQSAVSGSAGLTHYMYEV